MAIEDDTMELHPEERIKPNLPPQQFPYLLPEIIVEILSRLPVKSLLQFRSVSKSWRSLIDNPKFAKTHHDICAKNAEISHHRLIFTSLGQGTMENCHISHVLNGLSVNPTEHPHRSPFAVGSVNGLICIYVDCRTFLWNPSTRISKELPHSGFELSVNGFGYDESTDDYKLGLFGTIGGQHTANVMVYSLRKDCWRRIGNFPSGELFLWWGKFVNGAIHWAVPSTQNTGSNIPLSYSIVSIDLAMETYGEVAQPSYGDVEFHLSLGVLGECLSVLCHYGSHGDVWTMKEYGVRESWMKLARLPYDDPDPDEFMFPGLLHISENGKMFW